MRKLILIATSAFLLTLLISASTAWAGVAPHGNYGDTTDYCVTCHDVHDAKGTYVLTREATVTQTCNVCHGLFGQGSKNGTWTGNQPPNLAPMNNASGSQYAAYENTTARQSGHRLGVSLNNEPSSNDSGYVNAEGISDRNDIPGGSANLRVVKSSDYGYDATNLYSGDNAGNYAGTNGLYCASCHTPHGAPTADGSGNAGQQLISSELAKNGGTDGKANPLTAKILSSRPNHNSTMTAATSYNGFCLGCHNERDQVSVSGHNNHPPFCTTCHGNGSGQYVADFPHTSGNSRLLEKSSDQLCLDCHKTSGTTLP